MKQIEKQEKQLQEFNKNKVPFRFRILNSNLSLKIKKTIIDQLDHYYELDEDSTEYYKLKSWIDNIDKVPFEKYHSLPIKITDKKSKIDNYIENVYNCLEKSIYGHNKA